MAGNSRSTLEELLANVPQQYLNKPCKDKHLYDVAQIITEWPVLALYLKLTDTQVEDVTSFSSLKLQRIKLLETWRQCYGQNATYLELAKAFFAAGRVDLVEKIQVECPHMEEGCKWTNELKVLEQHLNATPRPGAELSGCEYVDVSCAHGCERKFQRHSLQQHMNDCSLRPFSCEYCGYSSTYQDVINNHWVECPRYPLQCPNYCEGSPIERKNLEDHKTTCSRRPFSCEYCSYSSTHQDVVNNHWMECPRYPLQCPNNCEDSPVERKNLEDHKTTCPCRPFSCEYCSYSSTYRDVVENHSVECPNFPLQCPNNCEDSFIERQHLEDHLNKDCPLGMVNCEFQFAGCTAQVQRRDLEAHVKDNLPQHISQLSSTTRILEQYKKTASDETQRQIQSDNATLKCHVVVAIILALIAVLSAVIIMQHQQIQQLQHDEVKATEQIQQLQQEHIEATKHIQNLQNQLNHASVLVYPFMCTAGGPGLYSPTVNKSTEITVSLVSVIGSEYNGTGVTVAAELESEENDSITHAIVSYVNASKHRVIYTPRVRGLSKLHVKVNNIDIKGSPFSLFVSPENPQELKGLNEPWGIAINSRGVIYVTEWFGHKVSVLDTNKQKLPTIGSRGYEDGNLQTFETSRQKIDGMFRYPTGIDIDKDDNVYVASENKLHKFNKNGEHIKSNSSNKEIRGMRVHNDNIYVCDRDNHYILVYDLELTFIRQFGTKGTGKGAFNRPHDIAFDANGNAYVVEFGNDRVQVLKEDGKIQEFGREELNDPRGIHIKGDYVYVSQHSKVVVFRTSGDFVTTIGENLDLLYGITTDSTGRLYVCEKNRNRCVVF